MNERNRQGKTRGAGAPAKKKDPRQPEVEPREGEQGHRNRSGPPLAARPEAERLTPEERRRLFARNLDGLLGLVGLNRIAAASEIGIDYKLLRRFVTAGISKVVRPNEASLTMIATFFALPSIADLWRSDLLPRLLSTEEGHGFVDRFRPRLLAERERRLAEQGARSHDELVLLSRALGFESAAQPFTGPWADKVRAILASPKAEQFKRVIDDYYQLALVTRSAEGHNERV